MYEELAKALKDATQVRMSSEKREEDHTVVLRVTRKGDILWGQIFTWAYLEGLPKAGIEYIQGEHFAAAEMVVDDILRRVDWSKFYG